MSYNIKITSRAEGAAKRLIKKYPSLKQEVVDLSKGLSTRSRQGVSFGNNIYKIRLGIAAKGKGKSGGVRVITFVSIIQSTVFLISIYSKSEKDDISDKELQSLVQELEV